METAPRLHALTVRGYRSLRDVSLTLGNLTVLIGPNGAGKSNVLDALRLLNAIRRGGLRVFVGQAAGASTMLHRQRARAERIEVKLAYSVLDPPAGFAPEVEYEARLVPSRDDGLVFDAEYFTLEPLNGLPDALTMPGDAGDRESAFLDETRPDAPRSLAFPAVRVYHFHDTSPQSPLRTPARRADDGSLREDGGNLAAFLARLHESTAVVERVAWAALTRKVREIAPPIHLLRPTVVNGVTNPDPPVRLDWEDAYGNVFGCHQLSDGTLRAIALLTALHQPAWARPALMAFDEPELGLHPTALQTIAGALRSASASAQILVATQAPALLDEVTAEDVVVCDYVDGATALRRLSAADLDAWLDEYTLSDLWHMNVIGGRP